ncbi:MCE family protein [Steroidobacter sp. S1-65]|uniref:MCE family protein n=1 Tax=Steroidobacter gossypii TaxID=2805490 RepID=A0ABS1WSH2_9GAMM|nr:MlaD family protein [Steroidobacter gossypii]MBM0103910.1 MCE family protein [Steroidobacter gossypii]
MERDAHYVAVGAFILLVVAMAIGFVLWYTDANDGREYTRYEIYFTGSVSGLDRGSPVRFLGVDVGRVRRLAIDSSDATRVHVVVEVDKSAPISAATRASLGLQGVTGLLYVNLKEASDVDRNAPLLQGENYPVIEAVESDFDAFLASLPELMGRANTLLERLSRVVSDENLNGIAETIKGMRDTMATMPQTAKDVQQLVSELRATVVEIHGASESLRAMSEDARPEVKQALARMNDIATNLAEASLRVDRFTQQSEVQLGNFTEQGLFELERLMRETRQAAREFRDLSRSLQENPSQILYEPPESGVEIKP